METRRGFLTGFAAVGVFAGTSTALFAEAPQKPTGFPTPPLPADQPNPAQSGGGNQNSQAAKHAVLLQEEKEFRAGVEKLYQMAGELRDEVNSTRTTDVFSVQMYKRTAEIEKLAKQLKSKAKG